ncbi:Bacterial type II secretion system protein F domain protein [compost metagenome]
MMQVAPMVIGADPIMMAAACFVAVTSVTMVGFGLATPRERDVNRRIASLAAVQMAPGGYVPRQQLLDQPFVQRVLAPAIALLGKMGERLTPRAQITLLTDRLHQAGVYVPLALQAMLALRMLGVILAPLVWWLVTPLNPGAALIAAAMVGIFGLSGPGIFLGKMINQRREAIVSALPDALDLITACVEAGISFDAALMRITGRDNDAGRELREEFARYLSDIRMGRPRAEALRELSRRCGVADLEGVVAALIQADQLGVGIGIVLRTQSVHLRTRRRQRAQEAAMKAPIKMLFPLVFFIFPAMFVVTLGPAVLRVIDTFAKTTP